MVFGACGGCQSVSWSFSRKNVSCIAHEAGSSRMFGNMFCAFRGVTLSKLCTCCICSEGTQPWGEQYCAISYFAVEPRLKLDLRSAPSHLMHTAILTVSENKSRCCTLLRTVATTAEVIEEVCVLSSYLAPANKRSHAKTKLVTHLGKSLLGVVRRASLLGLGELSSLGLLSLVVCGALGFSSFLESTITSVTNPSSRESSSNLTYLATTSWYFQPTS